MDDQLLPPACRGILFDHVPPAQSNRNWDCATFTNLLLMLTTSALLVFILLVVLVVSLWKIRRRRRVR